MSDQEAPRKPRADVVRNRAKILEVAQRHFQAHGVTTSLEAVTKDAGLGPATLYRHFPTREALLAALLQQQRDDLVTRQRTVDATADAGEALDRWLEALEGYFSLYGGLSEPLADAARAGEPHPLARSCEELIALTDKYLVAAQAAGHARPGLEGRDLFLTVNAVAWVRSTDAGDGAALARLRTVVRDGYRGREQATPAGEGHDAAAAPPTITTRTTETTA